MVSESRVSFWFIDERKKLPRQRKKVQYEEKNYDNGYDGYDDYDDWV